MVDVFYVAWLIFDPVKLLVVFIAIADSWVNFRQRWSRKGWNWSELANANETRQDSDESDN